VQVSERPLAACGGQCDRFRHHISHPGSVKIACYNGAGGKEAQHCLRPPHRKHVDGRGAFGKSGRYAGSRQSPIRSSANLRSRNLVCMGSRILHGCRRTRRSLTDRQHPGDTLSRHLERANQRRNSVLHRHHHLPSVPRRALERSFLRAGIHADRPSRADRCRTIELFVLGRHRRHGESLLDRTAPRAHRRRHRCPSRQVAILPRTPISVIIKRADSRQSHQLPLPHDSQCDK
jgi:hypothetical protein